MRVGLGTDHADADARRTSGIIRVDRGCSERAKWRVRRARRFPAHYPMRVSEANSSPELAARGPRRREAMRHITGALRICRSSSAAMGPPLIEQVASFVINALTHGAGPGRLHFHRQICTFIHRPKI